MHVSDAPAPPPPNSTLTMLAWSYRQDRGGEPWHLVPPGLLGMHGRTLCGQPRTGTRLSESLSPTRPAPSEPLCSACQTLAEHVVPAGLDA